MAKKKKYVLSSEVDYSGIDWSSDPKVQEATRRADVRQRLDSVRGSSTSTEEDQIAERVAAQDARAAAQRARAIADKKREEEYAARKQKRFDPQTLQNTLGYLGHSVTDPLDELLLSRRTADTANADGIGVLPAAEALLMGGYQALTGVPTDVELKAKVMNNRAAQAARIKDAQAMGLSTTPLEVIGGLTRMPGEVATMGASYAAEDFNKEVAVTGDVPRALDRSVKNSGLNAAFNMAIPGGKAITEVGLTAGKKLLPGLAKSLTPNAAKSATRLGAEEWAKHSLGTSSLMTTYGGTQLGINKYTAVFSDSEAQRKYANDQLPENAGEVMKELGQQALTGLAIGGLMGVKSASMTAGKAKAESLMEIQNTMDDLARQADMKAEGKTVDITVPEVAPVRSGPLDARPLQEAPDMFGGKSQYTKPNPEVITPEAPTSNVRDNLYAAQRQGQMFDSMPEQSGNTELGTLTNRTLGDQRAEALQPQVKEAGKLEAKAKAAEAAATTKALAKAKAQWRADRNKVGSETRATLLDQPEDVRVLGVARAMKAWEDSNPVPTAESVKAAPVEVTPEAAPVAPSAPAAKPGISIEDLRKIKPDATEADLAVANAPAADSFQTLVAATQGDRGGLAQKGEAPSNRASLADMEAELKGSAGSGEVRTLNALQRNGHVKVVADESGLPANAKRMEGSKAGWFEGDTAYVVADKLEKGKVVQGMLDVAGHEVKHGVDTQGKPHTYSAIASKIIGTDANKQIVAKIEKLAKNGDTTAQDIIQTAKQNPKTYDLEVAAHALNRANFQRSKVGAFAAMSKDLLSTVRTSAKALVGSDNINLNDLHYLGKRMMGEVAESDGRLGRPDAVEQGLAMTIGPKYKNPRADITKMDDLPTYVGEDGMTRAQLSDAGSKLNIISIKRLANTDRPARLVDLMYDNNALDGYRDLHDSVVVAVDIPAGTGAAVGRNIQISKADAIAALSDPVVRHRLKQTIIHETQHLIQDVEGFSRGGSPSEFITEQGTKLREEHIKAATEASEDAWTEMQNHPMNQEAADIINSEVLTSKQVSDSLRNIDPELANKWDEYIRLDDEKLAVKGEDPVAESFAHYRRLNGEQEAQLAQRLSEVPQSELNPYPLRNNGRPGNMYNTESTVREGAPIRKEGEPVYIDRGDDIVAKQKDGTEQLVKEDTPASDYVRASQQEGAEAGLAYKGLKDDAVNTAADKLDGADRFLNKLLSSSGVIGEKLMELIRQRGRDAAMMGEHAQSLRVAIRHSVEALEANDMSKEAATAYISEKADLLSKVPSVEAREMLALDMAKNDPIMAPVIDGFRQINDATRILIRQELEANKNITTERLKELKSMWDNQWSYTTRSYAAFQGDAGIKYAKALIKYVQKARKKEGTDRNLTPEELKYSTIYKNATDHIINSDLTMPQDLTQMADGKREFLHDAWVPGETYARKKGGLISRAREVGKTKAEAEVEAIAALNAELESYRPRSEDAAELQAKADYIAESILGLRDASDSIAQIYRGSRADDSIMKHRTDIPQEIRALLGEISDPGLRLSLTLMKQGELIAGNKLLTSIRQQGIEEGWISPAAEAYKTKGMGTAIQEDYLGVMNGMVTTPEIATVLNTSVDFINQSGDMLTRSLVDARSGFGGIAGNADRAVQVAARGWKRVTVAYNPFSHGRDFIGSAVTLLANGTLLGNPLKQLEYYGKGGKLALENIVGTYKGGAPTYSNLFDDAVRYGLFESVKVHELRTAFGSSLRKEINPSNSAALFRKAGAGLKRADATVIQIRAMTDAWTKIPIWLERVDSLSKYYEAQGIKKTLSEIKAEAGRDMRKTTVTQEQVPAFAKFLETRGITTFLPYYIAATRALKGNFEMGYTDIMRGLTEATTPEARNLMIASGTKRLVGSGLAVTAMSAGINELADWWNGDGDTPEERKKSLESVEALKQLMFPNAKFGEVLYAGRNEKNEPVFVNATSFDPYGPVMDMVRIMANSDISTEEKGDAILKSAFDTLTSLNKGPVDILKFIGGVATGKTPRKNETKAERMAPTLASYVRQKLTGNGIKNLSRDDANNFLQVISDYTPGVFNFLDPNNQIKSDGNKFGQVVMYTGGRMESANVGAALGGTGAELKGFRNDTRITVNEMIGSGAEPKEIFQYVSNRAEKEQELTSKLKDAYGAMTVGLGKTQSQAVAAMRGARLDKSDIANAVKGKAYSDVYEMLNDPKGPLNPKAMGTWAQNRARRKGGDEKAAAREGKELMDKFRVLNLKSGKIQEYREQPDEVEEGDDN